MLTSVPAVIIHTKSLDKISRQRSFLVQNINGSRTIIRRRVFTTPMEMPSSRTHHPSDWHTTSPLEVTSRLRPWRRTQAEARIRKLRNSVLMSKPRWPLAQSINGSQTTIHHQVFMIFKELKIWLNPVFKHQGLSLTGRSERISRRRHCRRIRQVALMKFRDHLDPIKRVNLLLVENTNGNPIATRRRDSTSRV